MAFFGTKMACFEGWNPVQIVLGAAHIVQQLFFSLFPSILMGLSFIFWPLMGYFFIQSGVQNSFEVHSCSNNFDFL